MIPQNLNNLEHFRSDKRVQFKEEVIGDTEVIIPHYMVADSDFWDIPYSRELRGHVYRKSDGMLMAAAFHKFFNIGEREETLSQNIDWDNIVDYTYDKVDGSLIIPVVEPDTLKVFFKTKKSFYSDVALTFTDWFWKQENAKFWEQDIIKLWSHGFTPLFEFYHPDWQIVLNYGSEPKMWWLNTRRWSNGDYYDGLTDDIFKRMDKAAIEVWPFPLKNMIPQSQKIITGVEGWILYDAKKFTFYKAKTSWYLQQHRVRTQMRERDVAELAALEQLDDVKSLVSEAGLDLKKIEDIEAKVSNMIQHLISSVNEAINIGRKIYGDPSAKEMALHFKDHRFFSLIMTKFRGKEPDYVGFFMRNNLELFSLKNVYNEKF